MNENATKTTTKQRIIIMIVAIMLVISTIAVYFLLVLSSSKNDLSYEEIIEQFNTKYEEYETVGNTLSEKYFTEFSKYRSNVKAYNEANATNAVLDTKDLKEGDGRELAENDNDYMAYYIGWCADGEIFDSSFNTESSDDINESTFLDAPLVLGLDGMSMIDGWNQGVVGMKLGGVRQITMAGSLAYGDTQEICGGTDKPLRFIVMVLESDSELKQISEELNELDEKAYEAYITTQM